LTVETGDPTFLGTLMPSCSFSHIATADSSINLHSTPTVPQDSFLDSGDGRRVPNKRATKEWSFVTLLALDSRGKY
jgi:hypothetical protein